MSAASLRKLLAAELLETSRLTLKQLNTLSFGSFDQRKGHVIIARQRYWVTLLAFQLIRKLDKACASAGLPNGSDDDLLPETSAAERKNYELVSPADERNAKPDWDGWKRLAEAAMAARQPEESPDNETSAQQAPAGSSPPVSSESS